MNPVPNNFGISPVAMNTSVSNTKLGNFGERGNQSRNASAFKFQSIVNNNAAPTGSGL